MKLTWKNQNKNNKRPLASLSHFKNLPFDQEDDRPGADDNTQPKTQQTQNDTVRKTLALDDDDTAKLAEAFHSQGNKLAEDGRYREALGKWEAALTLMPERAVLHEQKAQVLLEIGESWNALKAANSESLFLIFY
ncbi:Tetratricopeptide repeat protein like, partial [Actinidia chinensis var. chinensis]